MLSFKRPSIPTIKLEKKLIAIALLAIVLFIAYFWHLGTLTPGMSPQEVEARAHSQSINKIYTDPINAPYSTLSYVVQKMGFNDAFSLRLISVLLAIGFLICFYKLSRMWFGKFIGWISTLIIASTPLVILSARNATPDIMYLLPLAIVATYYWFSRQENPSYISYLTLIFLGAISVYTPGLIWLLAIGIFLIKDQILNIVRTFPLRVNLAGLILIGAIVEPIVSASINSPSLLKDIFLVPDSVSLTTLKNIAWAFFGLAWHSLNHNQLQIDNLPLLNAAQIILTSFGIYALWSRARVKTYALIATSVIGLVLFGVMGQYSLLLICIAPISILVAAGLRYLFIEWQGVFPVNPIPRGLALLLMALLALATINYGIRYSVVAWPETVDTKSVYVLK